jgi:hypothetical protein
MAHSNIQLHNLSSTQNNEHSFENQEATTYKPSFSNVGSTHTYEAPPPSTSIYSTPVSDPYHLPPAQYGSTTPAPSYSSPAPSYSSPAAPSYSSPAAPSYSAPTPSFNSTEPTYSPPSDPVVSIQKAYEPTPTYTPSSAIVSIEKTYEPAPEPTYSPPAAPSYSSPAAPSYGVVSIQKTDSIPSK